MMTALLALMLLCGCAGADTESKENETVTEDVVLSEVYTELPQENHFEVTHQDTLSSILTHGTAIVFLGFPECPWCQAYIPMLEEVLSENDALCDYYNIYTDKKNDREFYDAVASLLDTQNDTGEEILQYDNDGRPVIYMPLTLFIEKGRITAFDNETCMEDSSVISPEEYWTEDRISALKEKLSVNVQKVKELQTKNNSQGCDTGCKVEDIVGD